MEDQELVEAFKEILRDYWAEHIPPHGFPRWLYVMLKEHPECIEWTRSVEFACGEDD